MFTASIHSFIPWSRSNQILSPGAIFGTDTNIKIKFIGALILSEPYSNYDPGLCLSGSAVWYLTLISLKYKKCHHRDLVFISRVNSRRLAVFYMLVSGDTILFFLSFFFFQISSVTRHSFITSMLLHFFTHIAKRVPLPFTFFFLIFRLIWIIFTSR